MFCDIIDEEMKMMFKKQKTIVQMKIVKEKEMHVESIKFNFIESIHLKKIVARIVFLCLMYVVVYSMINVLINDVKIKTLFDSDVKINYILKKLINATQFLIRQKINIVIINFIDERARFFNVYKSIFVNIKNIIISIFIFVIKCSDHDFLLDRFFQRIVYMNVININDNLLKMMLHSLNDEK